MDAPVGFLKVSISPLQFSAGIEVLANSRGTFDPRNGRSISTKVAVLGLIVSATNPPEVATKLPVLVVIFPKLVIAPVELVIPPVESIAPETSRATAGFTLLIPTRLFVVSRVIGTKSDGATEIGG